jgi:hypothetical protein
MRLKRIKWKIAAVLTDLRAAEERILNAGASPWTHPKIEENDTWTTNVRYPAAG